MNLTWHIVLKDLRRLKLGLGIWTLMILGQIFVAERMFSTAAYEPGWFERQQLTLMLTIFVGDVFAFFLSAAIVLEDSLVGTRVFWVTRPISGGRLLAAKSLAILLAVVLWPLAIAFPWWIYCGFSFDQLLLGVRFVLLNQGIIALVAMTLAALAGEGSRFLLWTLTLVIALPLLTTILFNRSDTWVPMDVGTSRYVLAAAVVVLAALTVIGIQFRTRRVSRSMAVMACAAGLAILVMAVWPWNIMRFWPRDTQQRAGTEGIKIEVVSAVISEPSLGKPFVTLRLRAKDLPRDLPFWPSGRVEATFTWPDGSTFANAGTIQSRRWKVSLQSLLHLPDARRDPETEQRIKDMAAVKDPGMRRLAGLPPAEPDNTEFSGVIQLSPYWAERLMSKPPISCTVRLRIVTQQPKVISEMPWDDGTSRTSEGMRLRQIRMDHTKAGANKKTGGKAAMLLLISRPSQLNDLQYFFVNRRDGVELFVGAGGPTTPLPAVVMPVRYDLRSVSVAPPKVWRTDKWVPLPGWEEWIDAGSLVLIAFKEDGGFDREITTDQLVMSRF